MISNFIKAKLMIFFDLSLLLYNRKLFLLQKYHNFSFLDFKRVQVRYIYSKKSCYYFLYIFLQ